jgi:hypothetical protein
MGGNMGDTSTELMSRNKAAEKLRIIEQLQSMPIVELACKRAGVPRATYYRWLKADADFAQKCREALELSTQTVNDIAESQLITAIQERSMTAITFWLRNHHASYQSTLKLVGNITNETAALTSEQEELISKALRLVGLLEVSAEPNKGEQPHVK